MSFAAAAGQQQWMQPGLISPSFARGGFGGYATGASPLISTPSSAAFSSSTAATGPSRPLTPDGVISRNPPFQGAKGDPQIPDKTPSIPPALPPVYRLSSWPDFSKNDILGGGADHHDDLLEAEPDRLGDSLIITTAGLDDKLDPFSEQDKSNGTPVSEDANFFSSPPSEASDESTPDTTTPDDADSKTCSMTGPSHMAVAARPLTAKEYQRYRSQRRSEMPSRPTRSASARHQPNTLHDSRPRSGSEGCFGGLGTASGIKAGETVAMKALGEKMAYRKPNSSPACTTREEFEALPPAIQRKVSFLRVSLVLLPLPPIFFHVLYGWFVLAVSSDGCRHGLVLRGARQDARPPEGFSHRPEPMGLGLCSGTSFVRGIRVDAGTISLRRATAAMGRLADKHVRMTCTRCPTSAGPAWIALVPGLIFG